MTARLRLNFAPVTLEGTTEVSVGLRAYDNEVLRTLRQRHSETHVFYWDRDNNEICEIGTHSNAAPLSQKTKKINLAKIPMVWGPLLRAALIRVFTGKREILRDYPSVQILGRTNQSLISHPRLPPWVLIRTLHAFTPRSILNGQNKRVFGLVCDMRTRNQILATCDELIASGVSPLGRYVLVDEPARDARLAPRPKLIGKAERISGSELVLSDFREGYATIASAEARLEGRREIFDWVVEQLLESDAPSALRAAELKSAELHQGPGRLHAIQANLNYLRTLSLEAVPGANFNIGQLLEAGTTNFPKTELVPKPSLVFDPAGSRTDKWSERGIKQNGPYDQRTFSPKKLNIAVICQARYEGQVDAFLAKFLDGMPDVSFGRPGNERAPYSDGFQRRFRLDKANVQTFTASGPTIQAYEEACNTALENGALAGIKWDLAFVQGEEAFKILPGSINPYFGTKAILLKNDVPVQGVRIETIQQPDKNLVYTMNQLSLASYAKLGGVPWLLAADQRVAHELVIGIGSHKSQDSRFGAGERYVGITTVFSSDGSYLLSERTSVVPFENYSNALTDVLKKTIARVREEDNWRNTDRVRLVFHMFKPAKEVEAEAIKQAVESLKLENVTYAFLHIAPDHPFLIFDLDQKGLPVYRPEKGILGPTRGLCLQLGDSESLIVFSGASELKQASDGLPTPCLLHLHPSSTFKDMTYLARQAFDFTAHSWRIMSPERFPITIKYSDLIAERLAGLTAIPGWDNDAIRFRGIGRTLWFL